MVKGFKYYLIFLILILGGRPIFSQKESEFEIEFEKTTISLNEDLIINLKIESEDSKITIFDYQFPEIPPFQKIGIGRSKETILRNNEPIYIYRISQHYRPNSVGRIELDPLEFGLGETVKKSQKTFIEIVLGNKSEEQEEILEENIEESGPLLLLRTTNANPYIGEGFTLKFALYIPKNYSKSLNFYRNDIQLPLQIQKIQLNNCWQENYGIEEVRVSDIQINDKEYTEYCFFQSTYYPFNTKKIRIPELKLSLIRSEGNNQEKDGQRSIEYKTKPLMIQPKELPNGIPTNKYPVGRFEIREKMNLDSVKTQEKIELEIELVGNGNNLNWRDDQIESDYFLNINNESQATSVFSTNREMLGRYRLNYTIIPQKPGNFSLGNYFKWVYFNTRTGKLDTLKSSKMIYVIGQATDSLLSTKNENSEIYKGIEKINSRELDLNNWSDWKKLGNLVLILSVLGLILLFIRSRK